MTTNAESPAVVDMLTPEYVELIEHEKQIEQNLVDIGWHLQAIRDHRIYRAAGYTTFEDYCRDRLGMGRNYVNKQIRAAETIAAIAPVVGTTVPTPANERQVRPLTTLPAEERAEAWTEAVEAADGAQPTAAEVQAVVDERKVPRPKPEPDPDPVEEAAPTATTAETEAVAEQPAPVELEVEAPAAVDQRFRNPPLLAHNGLSFDFAGVRFRSADRDDVEHIVEVVRWVSDAIKLRIRTDSAIEIADLLIEPDPPRDEMLFGPVDGDEVLLLADPATAPPWKAYPYVKVGQLLAGIAEHGNAAKLRGAIDYERAHEDRANVIEAVERRIAELEQ